jgi:hypothetical protein
MDKSVFAKLNETKWMDVSDEVVRGIPRSLSDAEVASVAGGKTKSIVFTTGSTITVTNSISGGVMDDCLD